MVVVIDGLVHDAWFPDLIIPPEEYIDEAFPGVAVRSSIRSPFPQSNHPIKRDSILRDMRNLLMKSEDSVYVHVTSSQIHKDVLCDVIPEKCCGLKLGTDYGFVGGGVGIYHYCNGECERIYKRKRDLEKD